MGQYLEYRPDFYNRKIEERDYLNQLQTIANIQSHEALCITKKGFEVVGRVWQAVYRILGFLGFERPTNVIRVNYELLKFLHYGALQGYFTEPRILTSIREIKASAAFSGSNPSWFGGFAQQFSLHLQANIESNKDYDGRVNNAFRKSLMIDVQSYFSVHRDSLKPSIYRRCVVPVLSTHNYYHFGSTYLELASQSVAAKSGQKVDIEKLRVINKCYELAIANTSDTKEHQEELFKQLNTHAQSILEHLTEKNGNSSYVINRELTQLVYLYMKFFERHQLISQNYALTHAHKLPQSICDHSVIRPIIHAARIEYSRTLQPLAAVNFLNDTIRLYGGNEAVKENRSLHNEILQRASQSDLTTFLECYTKAPEYIQHDKENALGALRVASKSLDMYPDIAVQLCGLAVNLNSDPSVKESYQKIMAARIQKLLASAKVTRAEVDVKKEKSTKVETDTKTKQSTAAATATEASTTAASAITAIDPALKQAAALYEEACIVTNNYHLNLSLNQLQRLIDTLANQPIAQETIAAKANRHYRIVQSHINIHVVANKENGYKELQLPQATVDFYDNEYDAALTPQPPHIRHFVAKQIDATPGNFEKAISFFCRHLEDMGGLARQNFAKRCVAEIETLFKASTQATAASAQASVKDTFTLNAWNYYLIAFEIAFKEPKIPLTLPSLEVAQFILDEGANQYIPNETNEERRFRHFRIVEAFKTLSGEEGTALKLPPASFNYWNIIMDSKFAQKDMVDIVFKTQGHPANHKK